MKRKIPTLSSIEGLILSILASNGDLRGLEIIEESGGQIKQTTAYTTLNRMEKKRYVSSDKRNHGVRMYHVTDFGKKVRDVYEKFFDVVRNAEL